MLRSGKLFRHESELKNSQKSYDGLAVNLPKDTTRLDNLPAGGMEEEGSQGYRLGLIKRSLFKQITDFPLILKQTEQNQEREYQDILKRYLPLIHAIENGDSPKAVSCFRETLQEPFSQFLLTVHSQQHIESLISACAKADKEKPSFLYRGDYDCLIKRDTFAILLDDLIQSFINPTQIKLSFGLPTHHAYFNRANGFCLINKSAAMVYHMHNQDPLIKPIPFIVGLDINRDDGLNEILCRDKNLPFVHIDVHDPRVYPYHQISDIKKMMKKHGFEWQQMGAAHIFTRGEQAYHLIDLSEYKERNPDQIHPALGYAQGELNRLLACEHPVAIIAPTGYDACNLETAGCANYFAMTNDVMAEEAKQYQRLTMKDYASMFDWLLTKTIQSDYITGLYYSLEGGYTSEAYTNLVVDLVNKAKDYIIKQENDMNWSPDMKFM